MTFYKNKTEMRKASGHFLSEYFTYLHKLQHKAKIKEHEEDIKDEADI